MSARLTSIEEARSTVLAEALPLEAESRPLIDSLAMVVAQDLVAAHDLPPFDNSAMDGFAVRSSDAGSASPERPVELLVVDTIAAGHVGSRGLSAGEAARIMTGAPMPAGADAVAQVEITSEAGDKVQILESVETGMNVRRSGGDVRAGEKVMSAGTVLGPAEIGMAASLGMATLPVHRRPRVAILSTGSELVEVDRPLGPGQIHNSNGYVLRLLCQQLGIQADMLGIAADDRVMTKEMIAKGLEYDVLVTSGGVSVGDFDFVKEVQDELGVERLLWGVAMKPGKPLVFGKRGGTLVFGLPGNPVSAMVSFELFVRPALLRMMGYVHTARPRYKAVLSDDLESLKQRAHAVRVSVWRDGAVWRADSTGDQGSNRMRSIVGANGLVIVPAATAGLRAGDEVEVIMFAEPSEQE